MRFILLIAASFATLLLLSIPPVRSSLGHFRNAVTTRAAPVLLTPWEAVGGCGSSSGSVASDMQLKWIGRGVSGALFDFEAIAGQSLNFDTAGVGNVSGDGIIPGLNTSSWLLSLFYHPRIIDLKLTLPLVIKHGYFDGAGYSTGTISDMSLDLSKKWGMEGAVTTGISLSFPTGSTDIPQLQDFTSSNLAPPYFQTGSGMFGGSARVEYLMDRDWGFINVGASYSGGFFAMITDEYNIDTDNITPKPVSAHKTFKFSREGWGGINDEGTISPDNVSMYVDLEKKVSSFAHGISLCFSFPLRNGRWQQGNYNPTDISSTDPNATTYFATKGQAQQYVDTVRDQYGRLLYPNPVVVGTWNDGAEKKWAIEQYDWIKLNTYPSVTLQYSIEKSDAIFPILLGGMVRFEFDQGIKFASLSGGVGFKFPVY
ncbi:MAG: hypothetical protein WBM07_00345 [Chitinivibrionales bacterium]